MADPRKPMLTILIRPEHSATSHKIECFDATTYGMQPGCYRIRLNGRWLRPKKASLHLHMVEKLVLDKLKESLGKPATELKQLDRDTPCIPKKARVSAPVEYVEGIPAKYEQAVIKSDPILGIDGLWYVAVFTFGKPIRHIPVDDLIFNE